MKAVAVVGFPRCGSSMLMRMLDVGGIPPVVGSASISYELRGGLADFSSMPTALLDGHAVKLLDYGQWFGDLGLPDLDWRFIWSDRDPVQQARSNVKLMNAIGVPDLGKKAERIMTRSYRNDRAELLRYYSGRGQVLVTSFEDLLSDPSFETARLAEFLPELGVVQAAVVPTERSAKCAPDLAFEMGRAS